MSYKLFLDDLREVDWVYEESEKVNFIVVRNYNDFVSTIKSRGLPEFISFDNDLGIDSSGNLLKDGYAAAKWLVFESKLNLINLRYSIHSANPVASVQIKSLLDNYIKHLRNGGLPS